MTKEIRKNILQKTLALANDKEGTKKLYDLRDDHDFYVFVFGYMKRFLEYVDEYTVKDLS